MPIISDPQYNGVHASRYTYVILLHTFGSLNSNNSRLPINMLLEWANGLSVRRALNFIDNVCNAQEFLEFGCHIKLLKSNNMSLDYDIIVSLLPKIGKNSFEFYFFNNIHSFNIRNKASHILHQVHVQNQQLGKLKKEINAAEDKDGYFMSKLIWNNEVWHSIWTVSHGWPPGYSMRATESKRRDEREREREGERVSEPFSVFHKDFAFVEEFNILEMMMCPDERTIT